MESQSPSNYPFHTISLEEAYTPQILDCCSWGMNFCHCPTQLYKLSNLYIDSTAQILSPSLFLSSKFDCLPYFDKTQPNQQIPPKPSLQFWCRTYPLSYFNLDTSSPYTIVDHAWKKIKLKTEGYNGLYWSRTKIRNIS